MYENGMAKLSRKFECIKKFIKRSYFNNYVVVCENFFFFIYGKVPLHVLETIAYPELNIEEAVGPLMCVKML